MYTSISQICFYPLCLRTVVHPFPFCLLKLIPPSLSGSSRSLRALDCSFYPGTEEQNPVLGLGQYSHATEVCEGLEKILL